MTKRVLYTPGNRTASKLVPIETKYPHNAVVGLFLNAGFEVAFRICIKTGRVTDAQTIRDVIIATHCRADPLKKGLEDQLLPRVDVSCSNDAGRVQELTKTPPHEMNGYLLLSDYIAKYMVASLFIVAVLEYLRSTFYVCRPPPLPDQTEKTLFLNYNQSQLVLLFALRTTLPAETGEYVTSPPVITTSRKKSVLKLCLLSALSGARIRPTPPFLVCKLRQKGSTLLQNITSCNLEKVSKLRGDVPAFPIPDSPISVEW